MKRLRNAVLLLCPIVVFGCEAAPDRALVPTDALLSSANSVTQSASGSGHLTTSGDWRTFSFNAQKRADGTVTGRYQLNNRSQGVEFRGSVSCLVIDGNEAWVAAVPDDGSGEGHFFHVMDNGEGAGSPPDQITLAYRTTPAVATFWCENKARGVLFDIEAGNIQVRP